MYFGGSIALLAIGAILSFAVRDNINEIDLVAVGYILMAAGALGIILSLVVNGQRSNAIKRRNGDVPPPR
jgi:hypothetical protein